MVPSMLVDSMLHFVTLWIHHFYEIISTQLVIVLLLVLLFIVYLIPKILETWLSNLLSRRLPCDLTVQRFGFIFAEGVLVRFISGEHVFIRTVSLKSSLWSSGVSSLIVLLIDYVEFQTTHSGLYDIIQAIRRKNEGIYPRRNKSNKDGWPTLFVASISKFVSVIVRDVHVGIWPSVQLVKANSRWINGNTGLRSEARYVPRATVKAKRSTHPNESLTDATNTSNENMNMDYLDWATNSKLATTLMLVSLRVTFRLSRDCLRVRLQSGRICIKLFSTSEDDEHKFATGGRGADVDPDGDDDADDDLEGQDSELFTTEYTSARCTRVRGGMLLGHARLYPVVDLMFYRRSKWDGACHRKGREDREELCWRPKSVCLKLYGVRGGLMEELLELLKQKLHILDRGSPSLPTSPVGFTTPKPALSLHHRHHIRSGDSQTSAFGQAEISQATLRTTLSSSDSSSVPNAAFHLCLSVLPLRRMITGAATDASVTQFPIGLGRDRAPHENSDVGFRFELIRFVFKRSIQLTFESLLWTGVITPPSHRNGLLKSNTHRPRLSFLFPGVSILPRHTTCTSTCVTGDRNDGLVGDTCMDPGDELFESDLSVLSPTPSYSAGTALVRFKLASLHMTNGWDDRLQHCALDFRLRSVVLDACRRSTGCILNGEVSGPQLLYIYSPIETEFFTELVGILVATSYWLMEQRRYGRRSRLNVLPQKHNHTFSTIWASQCPAHRSSQLPSFGANEFYTVPRASPKYENNVQRTLHRVLTALGLAQRRLTVQFHLGAHPAISSTQQQSAVWPGLRSCATKRELSDACWSRLEDTADEFLDPLSAVCEKVGCESSQVVLVIASHSSMQGVQLGLKGLTFNCSCNPFEPSVASNHLPRQSDGRFSLSAFHLSTMSLEKVKGPGWLPQVFDGINGSPYSTQSEAAEHQFSAPTPSILLDLRSAARIFDQFGSDSLPQSDEHKWGQVLSVFAASLQFHDERLVYSLHGLQMEWPNEQLQQLSANWPFTSVSPCTCSSTSLDRLAAAQPASAHRSPQTSQPSQPSMERLPAVVVEGQVEDVNLFVVSNNGVVVVLRIDNLQSMSTLSGFVPCDQSSPCSSPEPHLAVAGNGSDSSSSSGGTSHHRLLSSAYRLRSHQQSKVTVTAIKMTYHPYKIVDGPGSTGSIETTQPSLSCRPAYRLHASDQLQHQLFWLPKITAELNSDEKLIAINCPQPAEFLWTPALHLCLQESIHIGRELLAAFYRAYSSWGSNKSASTDPFGTHKYTSLLETTQFEAWVIRFTAAKTIQLFMHLATAAHQVAFCFKSVTLRSIIAPRSVGPVNSYSAAGVPPSQLKLVCESALVRCDSESIAVFKQFTIRRRHKASHHRADYNKMGLVRNNNTAWEVDGDLCYFTFPYRYRFREVYLELTSTIKFIRTVSMRPSERCHPHATFPQPGSGVPQRPTKLPDHLDALPEEDLSDRCDTVHLPPYQSPTHTCPLCALSPTGSKTCPGRVRADWIIRLKRLVLEVKDDCFESNLNDNHLVMQDEQIKHEERVAALEEQLQWAAQSGVRVSESDRLACFARLEAQWASEYRTRLIKFKQEFPTADELFTWTLDNVHLKVLADDTFASSEQVIDRIRQMDSCSPWPHLLPSDFLTLWCRMVSMNADRWRFQLRDYPKPWLEMTDLLLWGPLAGAERLADWKGRHTTRIHPGSPWPDYTLDRNCWPLKFFYDWNADVKEVHLCYGANWEPTVAWLSQRLEDITPRPRDLSVPRLGWWDKVRHLLHGRLYIVSDVMHWLCSTSLNPYNATEFFAWQWNRSTVCWETGNFRLEGDLDILYHTASKYDGVCPLMHLPYLEMNIKLDWLSLRDPFDHHSVRPCNTERLQQLGITEHDSYRYFRGNRLAMRVSCTVRPPADITASKPWCLFFTSVLKFADKLRMCLTKVARPIRRGPIFHYTGPRKPLFGRLLQSLDFCLNLPQLELTYWVSYAKRTGVHVTTGPVQLVAELRYSIEMESKVNFGQRRLSVLQPHVMLPPANGCCKHSGLLRRPQTTWTVINLSSSLQDSRIQLRHRPDLPGQVVQMLLQNAHLSNEDTLPGSWLESGSQTDLSEEFIVVPLLHYEQVAPTPPPAGITVRVHIPGRRIPLIPTSVNASSTQMDDNTSFVGTAQSADCALPSSIGTAGGDLRNGGFSVADPDVSDGSTANDASQMTHEGLTPTHQLEVRDMKLRWTEHTRDLVYMLMDTYQHAQSLKRNLSARATQAFHLETQSSGPSSMSDRHKSGGMLKLGSLGLHSRIASTASNLTGHGTDLAADISSVPSRSSLRTEVMDKSDPSAMWDSNETAVNQSTALDRDALFGVASSEQLESESLSDRSWLPGLGNVPMLAQLLEEVDTARFYAYCEEEPKQTDVVGQLQGLNICASSPVAARNWHVELINSQLLLKTRSLAGYVLVTAARAKLNALAHPPIWRDAQLLNKSSLVGHLEGMQYFATVGQIAPGTCDQWLSTADVSDWAHLNPSADEDALSGRPEVVGCGRSVGGVVNACVAPHPSTGANAQPVPPCTAVRPIQLQRMISRCSCQVFYVHYEPADPANLPLPHLIPPLPLDENDIVQTSEGADTVTILHHTLNICTNSPQYHMIVGIVNDLILYVEPQRKAQSERNRVALGLMSESQVRTAILRDQECLRRFVAEQRQLERYLWTFARQVMSSLDAGNPVGVSSNFFDVENQVVAPDLTVLARVKQASDNARQLPVSIQYVRRLESQVTHIKTRIIEQNALLSQRLAHYQQLQIKVQRRHMQVAMTRKRHHTSGVGGGTGGASGIGSSYALFHTSASSASLFKHRKGDDRYSLSPTLLSAGSNTESHNRAINPDSHTEDGPSVCFEPGMATLSEEQLSASATAVVTSTTTASGSSSSQLKRHWSLGKAEAPPAAIVRRSEVCFEHAKWRMTESDGQIGLADVELRGFVYAKTHRQDDSGSHWLELGMIRVSNLVPDSFQKEVLAPDITCGHYAGGPTLRIACSELPPVGGISVKGAMEISVAPMTLQISKHFYRVMMPFFFPDKSDESSAVSTAQQPVPCDPASGLSRVNPMDSEPVHVHTSSDQPNRPDPGVAFSDSACSSSKPVGRIRRRFHQPVNLIRQLHRVPTNRTPLSTDFSLPVSHSTASPVLQSTTTVTPSSMESSSFNLTVEAAMAGGTSCTDMTALPTSVVESAPCLTTDFNRVGRGFYNQLDDVIVQHMTGVSMPSAATTAASSLLLSRPIVHPVAESNQEFLLNQFAALASGQQQTGTMPPCWPWSTAPPVALLNSCLPSDPSSNALFNWSDAAPEGICAGTQNTPESSNPVDVMRERARQNNVFLYIKIPGFPICLSYKGEKQKNLTDVTRFRLYIPTLEYHNCVWTWLDFAMEVKTRIRKQLIREVIKKKFTPRRRLPLIHFGRSATERAAAGADGNSSDTNALLLSSGSTAPTTVVATTISSEDASGIPSAIAQEQRVQREVEMLLGRHAQPQPPQTGKWRRLRSHRF